MNHGGVCSIWGTEADIERQSSEYSFVNSPRAGGRYRIDFVETYRIPARGELDKARLTSWLVEQRQLGEECPVVTANVVEDAIRRPRLSVHERADRLLRCVASEVSDIAGTFNSPQFESHPFTQARLAWSESTSLKELEYLMAYLASRRWVSRSDSDRPNTYQISVEGYSRIAELEQITVESSKAFVAMWFHESTNDVWETAIQPGIENAGYEPDASIGRNTSTR